MVSIFILIGLLLVSSMICVSMEAGSETMTSLLACDAGSGMVVKSAPVLQLHQLLLVPLLQCFQSLLGAGAHLLLLLLQVSAALLGGDCKQRRCC